MFSYFNSNLKYISFNKIIIMSDQQ